MSRSAPAAPRGRAGARAGAALALALAFALAACGGQAPSPDEPAPRAPDLTGRKVMVLPAQPGAAPVPASLDAELAYWLAERAPDVDWRFPAELRRTLRDQAGLADIRLDALEVGSFRQAEVKRVGDPLFGDLRRLGALTDARWAVVPVAAAWVPYEGGRRIEVAAALIDTLGGRVLWYGVVAGDVTEVEGPAAASAARALARALLPHE